MFVVITSRVAARDLQLKSAQGGGAPHTLLSDVWDSETEN
jgi:hypothetical protein